MASFAQIAQQRNARNVQNKFLADLNKSTSTIKPIKMPNAGGGGGGGGTPTPPPALTGTRTDLRVPEVPNYPKIAPALSAQQLGSLADRRRLADEAYQQALTGASRSESLSRLNAIRSRESENRKFKRDLEDEMMEFGGAGTARAPRVAGRYARRAGEDLRLKYGEIDSELSTNLSALAQMVEELRLDRDQEIARIDQDEALMRSALENLVNFSPYVGG